MNSPFNSLLCTSEWFRLPDDDEAVKKARRFAAERLDGAQPEFVDDVTLCVSEVLGNAVRRIAGEEDESGRGLSIVTTLAAAFWTDRRCFDKTVHVILARPGVTLTAAELLGIRG